MTSQEMLRIAMEQSAEDMGCRPEDFLAEKPVVVPFRLGKGARSYYRPPITAHFVSYGNNIVAAASDEVRETVEEYVRRFGFYRCFETPNLRWLEERLAEQGHGICFMAEYYLPDPRGIPGRDCGYECRVLGQEQFVDLYLPQWSHALCEERKHLDVLGVGAYDGGELIGLAACSADCDRMWQIGIDVLPAYRRQGIASALTSRLAREILARGKVPFYCSAWSNLRSVRNAVKSGFLPAWVEMTAKPLSVIEEINRVQEGGTE